MRTPFLALMLLAFAVPRASAEEAGPLQLRSKSAIAIATVAPNRSAPFVQPLGEPQTESLFPRRDLREEQSPSSCESGRDLCYDSQSGRIVYKPARQLMPGLPGLQAENISLKRDRIVFKYSF